MFEVQNTMEIPEDVLEEAKEALKELPPVKSRGLHEGDYDEFRHWMKRKLF